MFEGLVFEADFVTLTMDLYGHQCIAGEVRTLGPGDVSSSVVGGHAGYSVIVDNRPIACHGS